MLLKKEFYFVRHGQTDHNLLPDDCDEDQPDNLPLNATGRQQAQTIAPLIASLPIQTVCSSPTARTQETKQIITAQLQVNHYAIDDLTECSMKIWQNMSQLGRYGSPSSVGGVGRFINRVQKGINRALSFPGPTLIIAHGGIHWATCYLMEIENHEWIIDNCGVIHFTIGKTGKWSATQL
jgi:uncharacterized phosphatase